MGYRVLVDENIDPATAEPLRDRGHDAIHVEDTLGKGTADTHIAAHAREHNYIVLTNDPDFLRQDHRQGVSVFYVPEHAVRAHELAGLIDDLVRLIPDSADLPSVPWLTRD